MVWILAQSCLTFCDTFCDSMDCRVESTLLCLWNSLGKNTGVGCRFLLQYIYAYFDLIKYCEVYFAHVFF